ncbi:receptor-like protein kinase 7 [Solanum stenotomum]|uniref:receptor-like protein kinase 7 n=1 Tax=Solanum stenotomum TaxID=172797 RepID=UPI0020D01963|nr:receptor-like protein kinase 7 [Solanum stenotomum]
MQTNSSLPPSIDQLMEKSLTTEKGMGGIDGHPPDLATIFFKIHKKDNKLVEPEAIEKHAQLEEIVQEDPSLSRIEIVEKCCGPLTRSHAFGYGGTLANGMTVAVKVFNVQMEGTFQTFKLNIIFHVASALEFLHHGYSVPVIHFDLKPSEVLPDNEMMGHLNDFGIAKLL